MTILITIAILIGIGKLLPDTPDVEETKPKVEDEPEPTPSSTKSSAPTPTPVPEGCYDILTIRDNFVYLFQSKNSLQEGVNPKIFPDLPSYRVWAEEVLHDGLRCPVLFADPNAKPYVHPEEEYAPEVPMVKANIQNGKARQYNVSIIHKQPGTGFSNKPYLEHTPTNVHDYEHDLYKPPYGKSTQVENFSDYNRASKNSYLLSASTEPSRYIAKDGVQDIIIRSQHEGLGLGQEQPLPVQGRTFRDVPMREVRKILETQDPIFRGAKLKRTGISQYTIDEIVPEREEMYQDEPRRNQYVLPVHKDVPVDLLAYGGTVVPTGSIHQIL